MVEGYWTRESLTLLDEPMSPCLQMLGTPLQKKQAALPLTSEIKRAGLKSKREISPVGILFSLTICEKMILEFSSILQPQSQNEREFQTDPTCYLAAQIGDVGSISPASLSSSNNH